MKTDTKTPTVEIVPMDDAHVQMEYGLTAEQAKAAITKISSRNTKRKAAGQVTRIKGAFDRNYFA